MLKILEEIKSLDYLEHLDFIKNRVQYLESLVRDDSRTIGVSELYDLNVKSVVYLGGYDSSTKNFLKDDVINIQNGIGDIVNAQIGDITEAYNILLEKIKSLEYIDFDSIMVAISSTIDSYFGDYSNVTKRMEYYVEDDFIEDNNYSKISDLRGQNAAMCVERATTSHNLMKFLGIDSTLKYLGIKNDYNIQTEVHVINLVRYDGKNYVFDATIPTVDASGKPYPIVAEIPSEVYDKISSKQQQEGYSVETSFYSPYSNRDRTIVYDVSRKDVFVYNPESIKKL